jgi:hypothetical protein
MAFAADIGDDFLAIGKTNPGYFTQGRVRLLGGFRLDLQADATSLRAPL